MTKTRDKILDHIDELLRESQESKLSRSIPKTYFGTISIATSLYGKNSPQVNTIKEMHEDVRRATIIPDRLILLGIKGILLSIKQEIENGLIKSIRIEASGEVIADFISMAKTAIEQNSKDVAAVLACAALEDTLKRYAELNELNVTNKSMGEVINALKSKGLIKGTQGKILSSFTTLRNNAFHAKWEKIDVIEIKTVISFVEQFLISKFQ